MVQGFLLMVRVLGPCMFVTWAAPHIQVYFRSPSLNVTSSWFFSGGDTATHPILDKLERTFTCFKYCFCFGNM